jgi:hypothetical protein
MRDAALSRVAAKRERRPPQSPKLSEADRYERNGHRAAIGRMAATHRAVEDATADPARSNRPASDLR